MTILNSKMGNFTLAASLIGALSGGMLFLAGGPVAASDPNNVARYGN
jgi:hypothetical protein